MSTAFMSQLMSGCSIFINSSVFFALPVFLLVPDIVFEYLLSRRFFFHPRKKVGTKVHVALLEFVKKKKLFVFNELSSFLLVYLYKILLFFLRSSLSSCGKIRKVCQSTVHKTLSTFRFRWGCCHTFATE